MNIKRSIFNVRCHFSLDCNTTKTTRTSVDIPLFIGYIMQELLKTKISALVDEFLMLIMPGEHKNIAPCYVTLYVTNTDSGG